GELSELILRITTVAIGAAEPAEPRDRAHPGDLPDGLLERHRQILGERDLVVDDEPARLSRLHVAADEERARQASSTPTRHNDPARLATVSAFRVRCRSALRTIRKKLEKVTAWSPKIYLNTQYD